MSVTREPGKSTKPQGGDDAASAPTEARSSTTMTDTTTFKDEPGVGAAATPPLAAELQGHIGKHLRQVYGDLVKEPVPARFKRLLDDLAAREQGDALGNGEK